MKETILSEHDNRLDVLRSYKVLDSGKEKVYDDIARLTAELCDAPICLISLVEEDRQWFKAEVGLGLSETKIEQSICVNAIAQDAYLEIEDTQLNELTKRNELCQGERAIRFYAGAILRTMNGWPLGTLCVLDFKPRRLTSLQKRVLEVNANSLTRQLELTRALIEKVQGADFNKAAIHVPAISDKLKSDIENRFAKLTRREKEVMSLITGHSGNLTSKEIAIKLDISHRTVDHHRSKILSKMKVDSVAELICITLTSGIASNMNVT